MELSKVYLSSEEIKVTGQAAGRMEAANGKMLLVLAVESETGRIIPIICPSGNCCIGETVCGFYEGHVESIAGGVIVKCGGWL